MPEVKQTTRPIPPANQLARLIAEFQHRNESLHRHPVDGATCSYCNLVGAYAVRTLLDNAELLRMLVADVDRRDGAVPDHDTVAAPQAIADLHDRLGLHDRSALRTGLLDLDRQLIALAERMARRADEIVDAGPGQSPARVRRLGHHDGLVDAARHLRGIARQLRERAP